jgi:hypothetical protein
MPLTAKERQAARRPPLRTRVIRWILLLGFVCVAYYITFGKIYERLFHGG